MGTRCDNVRPGPPRVVIHTRSPPRTHHTPHGHTFLSPLTLLSLHTNLLPVLQGPAELSPPTQSWDPPPTSKALLLRILTVCHLYLYTRTRLEPRLLLSVESQEIAERRRRTLKAPTSSGVGSSLPVGPASLPGARRLDRQPQLCPYGTVTHWGPCQNRVLYPKELQRHYTPTLALAH